ncbi:SMI1/KNR4 family protein [Streptococcus ruminantium]|uniref:SMI1/KNR4 family protein n=1 Tax=Streptococcus ruminantium TaxID=1917441 RepID=UPI0012DCADFF|nr:SMI1/KNR4 family protein [Streptococcus ruminantium]
MLISKFENSLRSVSNLADQMTIKLPELYLKFLEKYNGGYTPKTTIKIGRKKDDIIAFFGMRDMEQKYTFLKLKKYGLLDDLKELNLFPIAMNSGGDYYVISISEQDYGAIYLLYHDLLGKKVLVAENFIKFIELAHSEKIGRVRTLEEREAIAISNGYAYKIEKLRPIWQEEIDKFSNMKQEEIVL